jgi:hypothetical protein
MAAIVQSPHVCQLRKSCAVPDSPVKFSGPVRCTRGAPPLGLTLSGQLPPGDPRPATVAFSALAPADLPDVLTDALIEPLGGAQYRLSDARRSWLIESPSVHLHRDVGAAFYRAIPPRPAPRLRRLFFRVVLWLAASHRGVALLMRLRGRRNAGDISGAG